MFKNKLVIASTFGSCTLLSLLGYSHRNEMLELQDVSLVSHTLAYSESNAFSSFIVQ